MGPSNSLPRMTRRWQHLALAVFVAVVTWFGWNALWFMTDDAYIHYRYVSNSIAGRGLVWNPAPFLPVEGYTSYLWVMLLRTQWAITGLQPPEVANLLGLLFGYGTLALGAAMLGRMTLPGVGPRQRFVLLALVLCGTATNRTFVTWLSSGLETSLFTFCMTWWVYCGLTPPNRRGAAWVTTFSTAAALAYLARPDGLLAVFGTLLVITADRRGRCRLAWAAPLLAVPTHFLWRHAYYGEWLPNTYYAKVVEPWPESGVRYALSFVIENGSYVWLALAAWWLLRSVRGFSPRRLWREQLGAVVVVGALALHFTYYSLVTGGDQFEFRHCAPQVLPLFLAAAWLASRLTRRPAATIGMLGACVLASYPIAWCDHGRGLRVADQLPSLLSPLTRPYDRIQQWLWDHHVCLRQPEHDKLHRNLMLHMPTREVGQRLGWDDRPVIVGDAVGVLGWSLPNVAIIDVFGLNDWVVARNPDLRHSEAEIPGAIRSATRYFEQFDRDGDGHLTANEVLAVSKQVLPPVASTADIAAHQQVWLTQHDRDHDDLVSLAEVLLPLRLSMRRLMSHQRKPPPGYVAGFQPNVWIKDGEIVVERRAEPLSDDDIIAHEGRFRAR